jgi:hypothetical protein
LPRPFAFAKLWGVFLIAIFVPLKLLQFLHVEALIPADVNEYLDPSIKLQ